MQKHKYVGQNVHIMQWQLIRIRQYAFIFVLSLMLCMGTTGTAVATTTSKSANYSVTESQFGGGSQQQCGTSYCAKSSAGDTTVGNGTSANYSAQFGANTTDQPLLQVIASGEQHNLGVLDSDKTATAVSTVAVRTYLMNGYGLQLVGSTPTQGKHAITQLMNPTPSHMGQEQFGVNLVANTNPAIGADPTIQPSGQSANSYIAGGYGIPNSFKYIPGDLLAVNNQESGEILYTLSMIFNVSNATPGGQYKGTYSAVVVPIF